MKRNSPWLAFACLLAAAANSLAAGKPNILFIAVDDLRPELGCYGSAVAQTPHLDALAKDGLIFTRAYCQVAICGPTRASLMTGGRPDTIKVVENYAYFRDLNPGIITLPQHFRANGYETVYIGKVFHGSFTDDERSWSRQAVKTVPGLQRPRLPGGYALPENQQVFKKNKEETARAGEAAEGVYVTGPAYECADVPDVAYEDGYNTELAKATVQELMKTKDKPFFLALGFHKPHLNWVAPKRYWDRYDRAKIPLSTQVKGPENGAAMGLHASFEVRTRSGIPKTGPIDAELARTLMHGYLACVSYVDAQVGRMIVALEEAGIRDNTIIVVWGDHGWHLGDMGIWGKATNYEVATRVPLIIWTPDMPKGSRGQKCDALVEFVDVYPSLCELAGLSRPAHLEGTSFQPLLAAPQRNWKTAAFSQFPCPALREWGGKPLSPGARGLFFGPLIEEVEARIMAQQETKWNRDLFENHLMGYTMRTDRYRFVVWKDTARPQAAPLFVEIYDHQLDPLETINIADRNPALQTQLMEQFMAGWKGSRPKSATANAGLSETPQ